MSATEAYFVTRTMRALELLAFGPLLAPQVAAELQSNPRTARRMLSRLADEQYVTRLDEPRRRYRLSLRLIALAAQAVEHADLPRLAAPFVERLHEDTTLTAHLVVPRYDCVLCLAHGVPPRRRGRPPGLLCIDHAPSGLARCSRSGGCPIVDNQAIRG